MIEFDVSMSSRLMMFAILQRCVRDLWYVGWKNRGRFCTLIGVKSDIALSEAVKFLLFFDNLLSTVLYKMRILQYFEGAITHQLHQKFSLSTVLYKMKILQYFEKS